MNEQISVLPLQAAAANKRVSRLRRLARARPWLVWAVALSPIGVSLVSDFSNRAARILDFSATHLACYFGSAIGASIVWLLLLLLAASRRSFAGYAGAALFVVVFTLTLGSQSYFFHEYRSYVNRDISSFAVGVFDSVLNQLAVDATGYLAAKLPFLAVASVLVFAARLVLRPRGFTRRHVVWMAPVALCLACVAPVQHRQWQAATPDALYFNAVGGFVASGFGLSEEADEVRPRARASLPVAELAYDPPLRRNVLFVITESVRADAACSAYDPECRLTPYTNPLLPDRVPLRQLRASDSTTATSLAVLWSGLNATEGSERLHTWPLLFDYATAAGWDTAYWTSQSMMFGNSRLWVENLGARLFVSATRLDPEADLDLGVDEALLAEHVEAELSELVEPFFAVIQLSNTHYPYLVHPDRPQPFQPSELDKSPEGLESFRNYYQNAVVQQDQHIARMIAALRETEKGGRTVIVYTSDHGEAFREHHQLGHTFTLYDEEIKVPGYVDAPAGTLSATERRNLEAKSDAFVFHVDVTPTMLDLMGIGDAPEIQPYKVPMMGTSWLRSAVTEAMIPMTNCSAVWSCAFEGWGILRGSRKVMARTPYDRGWRCFDLLKDPAEKHPLDGPQCAELRLEALRVFGRLPR